LDSGTCVLYDDLTGSWKKTLSPQPAQVRALAAITVGEDTSLVMADVQGRIHIVHPDGGTLQIGASHREMTSLCSVPWAGGVAVASGSADGNVRVWAVERPSGEPVRILSGMRYISSLCDLSVPGRSVVAAGIVDGEVCILDLDSGNTLTRLSVSNKQITAMSPLPVGDRVLLAVATSDERLSLWDPADGGEMHDEGGRPIWETTCEAPTVVTSVAPAMIGGRPVVVSGEQGDLDRRGVVRVWDRSRGLRLDSGSNHTQAVNAVCAVEADEATLVVSCSDDRRLVAWDPTSDSGPMTATLPSDITSVCTVDLPGGQGIAAGCRDHTIRLFRADGVELLEEATLSGHTGAVLSLCTVRRGGQRLASASNDGCIRIWNLQPDGQGGVLAAPPSVLEADGGWVEAVCAVPSPTSGDYVAAAISSGDLLVWNAEAMTARRIHGEGGVALALAAVRGAGDRWLLASAWGKERTVLVHDPSTGVCLARIPVHQECRALAGDDEGLIVGLESGLLSLSLSL
jgi:WD40 repeat protein